MGALVKVARLLMQQQALPDIDLSELLAIMVAALLKQAVERISRVRQAAAGCLRELLQHWVRPRHVDTAAVCAHCARLDAARLLAFSHLLPVWPHMPARSCATSKLHDDGRTLYTASRLGRSCSVQFKL